MEGPVEDIGKRVVAAPRHILHAKDFAVNALGFGQLVSGSVVVGLQREVPGDVSAVHGAAVGGGGVGCCLIAILSRRCGFLNAGVSIL